MPRRSQVAREIRDANGEPSPSSSRLRPSASARILASGKGKRLQDMELEEVFERQDPKVKAVLGQEYRDMQGKADGESSQRLSSSHTRHRCRMDRLGNIFLCRLKELERLERWYILTLLSCRDARRSFQHRFRPSTGRAQEGSRSFRLRWASILDHQLSFASGAYLILLCLSEGPVPRQCRRSFHPNYHRYSHGFGEEDEDPGKRVRRQ